SASWTRCSPPGRRRCTPCPRPRRRAREPAREPLEYRRRWPGRRAPAHNPTQGGSTMSVSKKEQQLAIERLRKWIRPGDTIYCILRHVSRSGMMRVIDLVKVGEDGEILNIGYNAALALGWPYDRRREGVRVSGTGMD